MQTYLSYTLTEIKRENRLKKRQINSWNLEQNNRTFEKEVRRGEKKKKGKEVSWRSHRRRHKQVKDSPKDTYLIKRETGTMNMRNSLSSCSANGGVSSIKLQKSSQFF